MSDHCEEQEMEQEALEAIFDDALEVVSGEQPFKWAVSIWPEQHSPDENHVGIKLISSIPLDYPEVSLPEFEIELLKGLTEEHMGELVQMAKEEAEANMGMPVVFAVCEKLREWLLENNVKGMDDVSMYAQMMRREKEAEKQAQKVKLEYESQKHVEEMTEAEAEQLAVQKRRAEGTPCNKENFLAWFARFEAEIVKKEEDAALAERESNSKKKNKGEKVVDKSGRITGFLHFNDKIGTLDLEAIEAAAENAQVDEDEEVDVEDENLFMDDDDLDDLDFDDDDDDDDEPDI